MWGLDNKESWMLKNWCFRTVVLEKTLESPLDCKEIQPVYPKGDQSWVFIEGLILKLKLQYFGQLQELTHWKRPWYWEGLEAGGEWDNRGWVGWMDQLLYGHELEQVLGFGDGQGHLVCCSLWDCKESDTAEGLNWTEYWTETYLGDKHSFKYILADSSRSTVSLRWALVHKFF